MDARHTHLHRHHPSTAIDITIASPTAVGLHGGAIAMQGHPVATEADGHPLRA